MHIQYKTLINTVIKHAGYFNDLGFIELSLIEQSFVWGFELQHLDCFNILELSTFDRLFDHLMLGCFHEIDTISAEHST